MNQEQIFNVSGKPIVNSCLAGFNGTIFAYGQTASGKTYTMQGPDIYDLEVRGLMPRMIRSIFDQISQSPEYIEWQLKVKKFHEIWIFFAIFAIFE